MAEDSNTFLVIDGVPVEDVEADDYSAYEEEYSVSERMISGRRVEELGAVYWVVEVNYSAIDIDTLAALQAQLRTRREHQLFFLPSTGGTGMVSGVFHLTARPKPSLNNWRNGGAPGWHGVTLRFEEVEGHD